MIKVYDDFLDQKYFDELYGVVSADNFSWYYTPCRTRVGDGDYQFIHTIFDDYKVQSDELHNLLVDFYRQLNVTALIRNKLNCTIKENTRRTAGFHTDNELDALTAIFYLNTNNGKTIFESGEGYESKANRLITFPSKLRHSGMVCTDVNRRMVMNVNFYWQNTNNVV